MVCLNSLISFIFFQIDGGNIKKHTVQNDSDKISLRMHFFSMLGKRVGLSLVRGLSILSEMGPNFFFGQNKKAGR